MTDVGLGHGHPLPRTLLPLNRYARIMGIYLPHFNQMAGPLAPTSDKCQDTVWDQDARDYLAWTMIQAEEMIALELGFWPAPKYTVDEELMFGLTGVRNDWRNAEVQTTFGQVIEYGTELLTLKEADAPVTYSNLNSNPYNRVETGTVGQPGNYADIDACANACETALFVRVADGADDPADPRWEIRPTKVDIDGTTMKIEAPASAFVKPDLWNLTKMDCEGALSPDPNQWIFNFGIDNLVTHVDVYCRTTLTQSPVTLQWDGVCDCTDICGHKTQTACAYKTDKKRGFFAPRASTWNGTTNIFAAPTYRIPPESVLVSYYSGRAIDSRDCKMYSPFERAIVKLTNVLLPEPPCGFCDAAQTRWKNDRKSIDPLTPEAASMPWDLYAQGALDAWRTVKLFARGRGGKMGRNA